MTGTIPQAAPLVPLTAAEMAVKILVAGGFGVGKTTMVGSVSEIPPVSTESALTSASAQVDELAAIPAKAATTVAMDFGRITLEPAPGEGRTSHHPWEPAPGEGRTPHHPWEPAPGEGRTPHPRWEPGPSEELRRHPFEPTSGPTSRLADRRVVLYLFGTPGQRRFWFMWDRLARGALGAVVLVDVRRLTDSFAPIDYFEQTGLPFVVVVNEFDGAPAYPGEAIREALAVAAEVPVLSCDARRRDGAKQVLIALVEHVARSRSAGYPAAPPSGRAWP